MLTAIYHVSPSGSDSNDGQEFTPLRTIAKALEVAPPGATIMVAAGAYDPFTASKASQIIRAAPGETVTVRGQPGVQNVIEVTASGVTLLGLTVTGCVPNRLQGGDVGHTGSAAVRIDDGAVGVTLQDLTIRDSKGMNEYGLQIGCYGILVHNADGSRIIGNDISGTGTGVYINGGGKGAILIENKIHDNDALIRNTPGNDDDYGANGVGFVNVNGLPGAVAKRNVITGNSGPSSDYGWDGGAFEIYKSSNLKIVDNKIRDNEAVLETGTDPIRTNSAVLENDDPAAGCVDNTFSRNEISGRANPTALQQSVGLILRCATRMVVADNTFTNMDWYIYDIFASDPFSTDVDGLTITGNTLDQVQKVYHLALYPGDGQVKIDTNKIRFSGAIFSSYFDGTTSPTLAAWQARSGMDKASKVY